MHGQMPTYYKQIKNVKLEYPIGKLQFRNQDSNKALLNTGKINIIRLSYAIYQKTGNPCDIHEAIIRQNLIHSPGYGLFATPGDLNGNDIVAFNKNPVYLSLHGQFDFKD